MNSPAPLIFTSTVLRAARVLLLLLLGNLVSAAAWAAKPNIILIYLDDIDPYLLSDAGLAQWGAATSRELRDKGTVFPNYLSTTPLCGPSRAALLTGRYNHNNRVVANGAGYVSPSGNNVLGGYSGWRAQGTDQDPASLGPRMQSAGYFTAFVGKYINQEFPDPNNPNEVVRGWDEQRFSLGGRYYQLPILHNGVRSRTAAYPNQYRTDFEAQLATTIIRSRLAGPSPEKPLFMILAPFATHGAVDNSTPVYADRHAGLFQDVPLPQAGKPSFNEADMADKSGIVQAIPSLSPTQIGSLASSFRNRLRSMVAVDEMLQSVIDALQETGQLGNTYIFLTSDNGYLLGEHRMTGKELPYSETYRFPLYVRGPGVRVRQLEHLVANIDLYPSFADIAGIAPADNVDGRSIRTLLKSAATPNVEQWRRQLLVESHVGTLQQGQEVTNEYALLRSTESSYVEWYNGDREFYDLLNDPHEIDNIYSSLDDDRRRQLSQELEQLKTCKAADAQSPCRPVISILQPAANSSFRVGNTLPIRWETRQFNQEQLRIELLDKNNAVVTTIAAAKLNDGALDWPIAGSSALGDNNPYRLRLTVANDNSIRALRGPIRLVRDSLPTLSLSASGLTLAEPNGSVLLTATLSKPTPSALSIELEINPPDVGSGPFASSGVDFKPELAGAESSRLRLDIPAGSTSGSLWLLAVDDAIHEGAETLVLRASPGTGYAFAEASAATEPGARPRIDLQVSDNENTPRVGFPDTQKTVVEGATAKLLVQLSGASAYPVRVHVQAQSPDAGAADFSVPSGPLTIPPGSAQAVLSVSTTNDAVKESTERVVIRLESAEGASLGPTTTATVYIRDND